MEIWLIKMNSFSIEDEFFFAVLACGHETAEEVELLNS